MGKIQISDEDLKLIMNSIDFRIRKINKYLRNTNDRDSFERSEIALNKLLELSYRLRIAKREA